MPFYYGGDKDDWVQYKAKGGREHPGDHTMWDQAGTIAERVRLGQAPYADLKKVLDTQQFADWMLNVLASGVADIQWYATYTAAAPKLGTPVNPVRFWVWDAEDTYRDPRYSQGVARGYCGYKFEFDGLHRGVPTSLWTKLQGVPEFKLEFADRMNLHLRNAGAMTDEAMLARFRAWVKVIETAVIPELARWGDSQGSSTKVNHNAPLVTYNDWKTKAVPHVEECLRGNAERTFSDLKRRGFFPAIDPPKASRGSGDITGTVMLTLDNGNGKGDLLYTTDGTDPRRPGGEPDPKASKYTGPIAAKEESLVLARVRDGTTWSALTQVRLW
jgi:hypothetical protein